jgi:hypothetical protein
MLCIFKFYFQFIIPFCALLLLTTINLDAFTPVKKDLTVAETFDSHQTRRVRLLSAYQALNRTFTYPIYLAMRFGVGSAANLLTK